MGCQDSFKVWDVFCRDSNGNGSLSLAHDSTVKRLLTLNVE